MSAFFADIKAILDQARSKARLAVNSATVEAYWLVMREEDPKVRSHTLAESAARKWTVRQLERNLQSRSFQLVLSSQDSAPQDRLPRAEPLSGFTKDPYVLEFLQLPESG